MFGRKIRPVKEELVGDALRQGVTRQKDIIAATRQSFCPNCNTTLRLVAYENNNDLTHFEAAIVCDNCGSKFVFNEKGLRGQYVEPTKSNV